jgi:hypothetical protein
MTMRTTTKRGKCLCPLELRAGIMGGLYTPVLARQVTYLMGHMTSDETSKVFAELGVSGPSSSSCDRLPKLLSAVWESHREHWESALRQQEVVAAEAAVVAVSLDGVMVPDKDAQRFAKATREAAKKQGLSKQCSGPAGYREVGCGTVTLFDVDAKQLDTVRYGRAPEYKKQTLTTQLDAELASILAVRPDLEVVALAEALVPFRATQSSATFMPLFESRRAHGARSHGPEALKPLPGLDGS